MTLGLKAQFARNTDYGIFLGTAYYLGDVNPSYHFDHPNISVGGILRKNLSSRYSIRATLLYSKLSGSDKDFENPFKQARGFDFNTTVLDFGMSGEFNFVPYGEYGGDNRFTPYFSLGMGAAYFITPENSYFAFIIPFSVGGKIKLSERVDLCLEWAPRKTFTDDIEGMGSAMFASDSPHYGKQRYFKSDDDWFYSVGAYLTIKFWESKGTCRAYRGFQRR